MRVAAVFVTLQAVSLIFDPGDTGHGLALTGNSAAVQANLGLTVGIAMASMGLATAGLLLLAGRGLFLDRTMRALVEDESTRAHRGSATAVGYWATMFSALGLYLYGLLEPLTLTAALHVLLAIGVGAALIRFGFLEWRAVRG